ncbi:efflux RND transporter periplasmic adaptor subunit [Lacipirellula sp.]|uniref:efflux RND transporter periplasmic adaptor subunit n=1 Tax=Lacipirellula sp. TaxID=2691419 RepID=UPI003D13E14B
MNHSEHSTQQSPQHAASEHDEVGAMPPAPQPARWKLALITSLAVALAVGVFYLGWTPKANQQRALAREVDISKSALPRVRVTLPRAAEELTDVLLPADIQAMQETVLYPRTNGYVLRRHVDIGDQVEAGQLLAEIATPEVDAEVMQAAAELVGAEATLESEKANANLAEINAQRYRRLIKNVAASQQMLDDAEAALLVANAKVKLAEAAIQVAKANLQRVTELQSFAKVTAPFAGVVTARSIEVGQLVTAGNAQTQALFRLASTNPVRVFVNVPQVYAAHVAKDLKAQVVLREQPTQDIVGKVTRTARAIDPNTRTLLTEIQVPNDDGALLIGSYAQVKLQLQRDYTPLLIPSSAIIFNSLGTQVAAVTADNRIALHDVQIERDMGSEVGIASGLAATESVVTNPGDRMSKGLHVEIDK